MPGVLAALLHHLHGLARSVLQGADHALNLVGRLRRALGQTANFIGDHGEPSPLVAGPGGLDGGIECQ
ncbi:hypothetical protein D3C80_1858260 [compost metagenome]